MEKLENVFFVKLPLITDLAERTIVHAEAVRDSPCGSCGKKSMMRTRHYTNSDFTLAFVFSACEDHLEQLKHDIDMMGGTLEAIHVNDTGVDFPED